MRQSDKHKPGSHAIALSSKRARSIAASGMALTLCMLSLMLFRGLFSLLQALIIPVILALLASRQPRVYTFAAGVSLLVLTLVFFPTQFVFMMIYLLMTFLLLNLLLLTQSGSLRCWLLFFPYLMLNSVLLYIGLRLTDFAFATQLHTMMLRLSGDNRFRYAAIMLVEAIFISSLHLLAILFVRRRQIKTARKTHDEPVH